jgi:hypothetical protein
MKRLSLSIRYGRPVRNPGWRKGNGVIATIYCIALFALLL